MPGQELERYEVVEGELMEADKYEVRAAELAERYAGFVDANALTDFEKVASLASLVPMALEVVDEARDTIERLNDENVALREELLRLRGDTPTS